MEDAPVDYSGGGTTVGYRAADRLFRNKTLDIVFVMVHTEWEPIGTMMDPHRFASIVVLL